MPKITRHGGLTVHTGGQVLLPMVATVLEEAPCPGNSSQTSPAKQPKSDEPKKPPRQKPAPTTAGPSKSTKGSGTAPTGTTSGPATDA